MSANTNKGKSYKQIPEKGTNNVKPQNQHYNIKKQALGPNSRRGK